MANSVNRKANPQTYLRQIQQEKAARKRELMNAQKNDIKAVRDFYTEQSKQLDSESAAAVNHIKEESRQIAAAERAERAQRIEFEAEQKRLAREEAYSSRNQNASEASAQNSVEKKNLSYQPQRKPLIQNYETKDTDTFYHVQDRGSRITENPQAYVIEAYAPEHEKDNLRVSIQRNKAIISGQRKFADEAEEPGKVMRTNNFQSFREEFQFDRPVSHEGMTRERVGDFIRFSIPKLEAVVNPTDEDSMA